MTQHTIKRAVLCAVLLLCSLSIACAQQINILEGYTPYYPQAKKELPEKTAYRVYQSTIYTPFSNETPSSASSVGNTSSYSGPRRLGGETVDPGKPPGKGSPMGDPALPMLLAAVLAIGCIYIRQRKKKNTNQQINNNY